MSIKKFAGAICGALLLNSVQVSAAVVFYTDQAAFNADANTSIIDFEGFVADDAMTLPANAIQIDNVIFTTDPLQASAIIFGKNFDSPGTDSALFVANNGNNIIIDLSLAGSTITAAGGIFGDYDGPAGQQVTFNIYDSLGGQIDTQIVSYGDMRVGGEKTFFGWIANGADDIAKIELVGDIRFNALDNFQYSTVVPVPAAVWLFGSGLLGLIAVARRKS